MWSRASRCEPANARPRPSPAAKARSRDAGETRCCPLPAICSADRSSRCSVASISRVLNRSRPAPVLAERDQLGRGFHRAHGLGELIGVVGVPVNEARQVVIGERALLPGDGVQRHVRLGDDLLAVAPGDLPVIDRPLGVLAPVQAPRAGRADLVLRLQVDPLRLQRPVIDPRIDVEFGQALVHMARPTLAPVGQKVGAIPLADLLPERPLPVRFHLAHRQHDVGVRLGQAVRPDVPMHIEIGDHPAIDELAAARSPAPARRPAPGSSLVVSRTRSRERAGRPCDSRRPRPRSTVVSRSCQRSGEPSGAIFPARHPPRLRAGTRPCRRGSSRTASGKGRRRSCPASPNCNGRASFRAASPGGRCPPWLTFAWCRPAENCRAARSSRCRFPILPRCGWTLVPTPPAPPQSAGPPLPIQLSPSAEPNGGPLPTLEHQLAEQTKLTEKCPCRAI